MNFIYGGNGAGKTTLSRLLACNGQAEEFSKCSISWESEVEEAVVYNKHFKEKNFKEEIPGVFTVGEDAVETIKVLDDLREHREELERKLRDINYRRRLAQEAVNSGQNTLMDALWQKTKKRRTELSQCLDSGMTKRDFAKGTEGQVPVSDRIGTVR